ncbi:DUF2652 domain-containing protein [Variovorax sp. JS1663]|uniref:DUF2652 domain-containing protein n=1 Tax=Variovorax sp. JS1663 TaxID=1851577 RepID=UPI000B3481B7|nr:DUF2652 domain-containing protein [Variovorax sp. JS1663]OUM02668.1 hypothetical protein A8M77_10425 [Variovorax sp. JS1663]
MATSPSSDNVLFFIPDIGGFTRFVAETEVRHSQHIVKGLLELLVDANQLGLEVCEFEGDAVLFCRTGTPPSLADLLAQAKKMFVDFHLHLRQLEMLRVCQCGACTGLSRLSLKFIAHLGPASTMEVKGHSKFIGKSIIVAHRLLKNSVPEPEYLLVTEETLNQLGDGVATASSFESGSNRYDEIGEVVYRHHSMAGYLVEAKVEPPEPFRLADPRRAMALSRRIEAPASEVYQCLIDLPARTRWIDGVERLELRDPRPNHIGQRHRCVGSHYPEVVTSEVKVGPSGTELWETEVGKRSALRYLIEPVPVNATQLTLEVYLPDGILPRLMFRLSMQKTLEPFFRTSLDNFSRLLEGARVA